LKKAFINKLQLAVIILISWLMAGCVVYHPMTTDVPLISKKNDLRVDAGISVVPSAHASITYGLTKSIAIQGFGSIGTDDRYYLQAATGFYKNTGNNRIFELYGGFGYGYGDAYNDANPGNLLGDYQLYFGQANYGKIAAEGSLLDAGFGIKAGYLHSNLTDKNYYEWISEEGPFKTYHDDSMLIEPVGFIRIGGEKLKFSVKLGGTWIYKYTNADKSFPYSYLNIGLGINYRF